MSFLDKIKQPGFWSNFLKVVIPFFIIVTVISILINSSSAVFSGDFNAVSEQNFSDGKWKTFLGYKLFFSCFYGFYTTNKNMK